MLLVNLFRYRLFFFRILKQAVLSVSLGKNGLFCFLCLLLICPDSISAKTSYEADIFKAAQTGDAESQYALAILYEYGGETVERNAEKAALWFEKAAQKKVAGACLYLGIKYENGSGVEQDYKKAHCMYLCAAQQDWPMAQFFLARLYDQGKGVIRSPLTALAWLGLAMDAGYPKAEVEFLRIKDDIGVKNLSSLKSLQENIMRMSPTPCN